MPLAAHSCPRSDPHSYQAWVLGGAAALVPLVLQKTLKGLSLIAASGLLVLCVGLATVTASGVIQFGGFPPFPSPLAAPPSPSGFAAFFGIAAFSFGGSQVTVLPVQDGMQRPERAAAALGASLVIAGSMYVLVGLALAWLFAGAEGGVQTLIILNLPRASGAPRLDHKQPVRLA